MKKRNFVLLMLIGAMFFEFQNTAQKVNIERLVAFAKLYGYVRYFYPGDESVNIDWNKYTFYGTHYLTESKDDLLQDLTYLVTPIAHQAKLYSEKKSIELKNNPTYKEPVYWQHLGSGDGSVGYPYKSLRINREAIVLPDSPNDYGNLRMTVDPSLVAGSKIRLSGTFKANTNYSGSPSLIIAYQQKGKDVVRISTEGQPISPDHWTVHEITADVPSPVEKLSVYIQSVTMAGSLLVDQINLSKLRDSNWINLQILDLSVLDTLPSHWKSFGPNVEFGLLKQSSKTLLEIKRTSGELMKYPPLFNIDHTLLPKQKKNIGEGLIFEFPLVVEGAKPSKVSRSFDPLLDKIAAVNQQDMQASNLPCRLSNVIQIWNSIQHFSPALHSNNKIDWEDQLRKALLKSFDDSTLEEHKATIEEMLEPLNDSHIGVYTGGTISESKFLPLSWAWIEDRLIITNVFDESIPLQKGDEILRVDSLSASAFWLKQNKRFSAATLSRKNVKIAAESIRGQENKSVALVVKGANDTQPRKLLLRYSLSESEVSRHPSDEKRLQPFDVIKDNIFYVDLTRITWDDLQNHFDEMETGKGLVFDLRGYPKWQTINIISHFIKEPVLHMSYGIPEVVYPDRVQTTYKYSTPDTLKPAAPFLTAPKIFLTNGKAISYAEDFMNLIKFYNLAEIIGEPTAGVTGNVKVQFLMGGLYVVWTGMIVKRQDGQYFNGMGVTPDILLMPSIEGILEGRDELLEEAIQRVNR